MAVFDVANECKNIYLDTAGIVNLYHIMHHTIHMVGEDRIVFGSDFPAYNPRPEIAKVLDVDLSP